MANSMQQPFDPETSRLIKNKARKLSRKRGFTASDCDDIEQELAMHLLKQRAQFNPDQGNESEWVSFILDKRCICMWRHRHAQSRTPKREEGSLNDSTPNGDGKPVERHEAIADAAVEFARLIDLQSDLAVLRPRLSEDAWLLVMGLGNDNLSTIAREQGWDRAAMTRHMRELRRVCEDSALRDYL